MANPMTRHEESWLPEQVEDWKRHLMHSRPRRRDPSMGLLIAGIAAVGLGYFAWTYLGPDLKRYMKIQSM